MQTNMQHTPTRDHAAAVPLGDFDVVEDGNTLVNRLYYAVPKFEEGQFSCSKRPGGQTEETAIEKR